MLTIIFKKIKNHKGWLNILMVSLFIASGCQKENLEVKLEKSNKSNEEFIVKNGILVFKSINALQNTMDAIVNLNDEERAKWETNYGFLSQRRIFSNIIKDESIQDSINEQNYLNDKTKIKKAYNLHSKAYERALLKGVIKVVDEGTDDESWDYGVFSREFIEFINEDGLYAIGDTLYHVNENSIMAMRTKDFSKANLLIRAKFPDEKNNIFLVYKKPMLKALSPGIITDGWYKVGDRRLKLSINLTTYSTLMHYDQASVFYFYHEIYVECQDKNWLGNWKYRLGDVIINGSWRISVFYYPQIYGNSYSRTGQAASFKTCINPETGSVQPYRTGFSVTANAQNQALEWYTASQTDYQPSFRGYNWEVIWLGTGITKTMKLNYD